MLQTQHSMARRFKLQVLRRYNVKFSKMRNFTLDTLRLDKLKRREARGEPTSLGSTAQDSTIMPPAHVMKVEFFKNKFKYFLPHLTDCVIFPANKYKVAENALRHMLLKLIIDRV